MKKILFLILAVANLSNAQWFLQQSGTTHNFMGVSFTDQNNGTAVGERGTILRTTDGGTNWFSQTFDTTKYLISVSFTDANTGTIVGSHIFRTTDGGTTWTLQTNPTYRSMWGVSFTDADHGTAVGQQGKIIRTTNGGTTWTMQTSGTYQWLNGVSFTDPNNGTAVGDWGTILRTTNGGMNWIDQSIDTLGQLWGVSFTDANIGTVVGDWGTILRTTNGGETWVSQTSGTTNYLGGVSFTDQNNGTAVGDSGTILRTTNGGTTWIQQTSGTTEWLWGVSFTDANNGTVVGYSGTILRTTNGGVPVELTSFTASYSNNTVQLNWSTATETNNSGFEIQRTRLRSSNFAEASWEKIGFVPGYGTTTEPKSYSFVDDLTLSHNPALGEVRQGRLTLIYRLKQIDYDGSFEYSQEIEAEVKIPLAFSLEQNYPNPFNPSTKIKYTIPSVIANEVKQSVYVTLRVYDVLGNEVTTLVNEEQSAGKYEVEVNATSGFRNLVSGIYFYQLKAGEFVETKKMVLMK